MPSLSRTPPREASSHFVEYDLSDEDDDEQDLSDCRDSSQPSVWQSEYPADREETPCSPRDRSNTSSRRRGHDGMRPGHSAMSVGETDRHSSVGAANGPNECSSGGNSLSLSSEYDDRTSEHSRSSRGTGTASSASGGSKPVVLRSSLVANCESLASTMQLDTERRTPQLRLRE